MKNKRRPDWRAKVNELLDGFESGARVGAPSMTEVSKAVGISRQTLWRDELIRSRFAIIATRRDAKVKRSPKRATLEERIRQLELKLEMERRANSNLVQNFVNACRRLQERGLDAHIYLGDGARDVELTRSRVLKGSAD